MNECAMRANSSGVSSTLLVQWAGIGRGLCAMSSIDVFNNSRPTSATSQYGRKSKPAFPRSLKSRSSASSMSGVKCTLVEVEGEVDMPEPREEIREGLGPYGHIDHRVTDLLGDAEIIIPDRLKAVDSVRHLTAIAGPTGGAGPTTRDIRRCSGSLTRFRATS